MFVRRYTARLALLELVDESRLVSRAPSPHMERRGGHLPLGGGRLWKSPDRPLHPR